MRIGIYTSDPETNCGDGDEVRFLRRLFGALKKAQDEHEFVFFTRPSNEKSYAGFEQVLLEGRGAGLGSFLGQDRDLERAIKTAKVEAVLSPLDSAPTSLSVPQVLHALHLRRWTEKDAGRRSDLRTMKKSAGKARAVVAPSQYIRRKLLELFDIPLDRVVVAPPGTDPLFEKEQESITSKPFFLLVGQMCKGVLLEKVLEGYEQVIKDHPASLVVVGDACDGELADWGPNVVRIESCADPHLAGLYQNCEAFFCLASCDGTGLQVLEAMRSGAPIIAPNLGAIAEYGGDAPAYFNPESTASFLRAVHRILTEDVDERDRRLRQGRQSAREFHWDKSAWKLLNAFKRV